MLISMLLEQLVLDLVCESQLSSRFGLLLHSSIAMMNVSTTSASDVVVLVV